jgi:cytochrome P450
MTIQFDPLSPAFLENPYPTYELLRAEAPVFRHPMGYVVLSRYADIERTIRTPEIFSSSPAAGAVPVRDDAGELRMARESFIGMDPPKHTQVRKLVSDHYTRNRVAQHEPAIRKMAEALFDRLEGRTQCDLMEEIATAVPRTVLGNLLGITSSQWERFSRWSETDGDSARLKEAIERLPVSADFLEELVSARRKSPSNDPLSSLVNGAPQGEFETDNMYASIGLMLSSGTVETSHLLGNAVLALLAHPEQLQQLRREPALIERAVEETLRYDAPVQMLLRRTKAAVELGGEELEEGTPLAVLVGSANRDEAVFQNAASFDLHRPQQEHFGFGTGRHFCIGAWLARLIARITLELILERMPNLQLATNQLRRPSSFLIRGPLSLPVRFDTRPALVSVPPTN